MRRKRNRKRKRNYDSIEIKTNQVKDTSVKSNFNL